MASRLELHRDTSRSAPSGAAERGLRQLPRSMQKGPRGRRERTHLREREHGEAKTASPCLWQKQLPRHFLSAKKSCLSICKASKNPKNLKDLRARRKEAGLFCGSFLQKGEVFAHVGLIKNLKDSNPLTHSRIQNLLRTDSFKTFHALMRKRSSRS